MAKGTFPALTAGVIVVTLSACGGSSGSSKDANGVRHDYKAFVHMYLNGKAKQACDTYMTARAKALADAFGGCDKLLGDSPRSEAPSDAQIDRMTVTAKDDEAKTRRPPIAATLSTGTAIGSSISRTEPD
jgi:hypothetical protein